MKKKSRQPFLYSLGFSLFLLLTVAGLLTVDYQGRRLSFGDSDLPFEKQDLPGGKTELQIKLLGLEKRVNITEIDKFYNFLLDFSCIPHS
ncbi:hypothetical protein [Neglectibacter caecimuris]|uniref:hypothetical protein n=1 Tax=Neglectibacter caecimuris TaxID=3093658 RepID=UPI002AC9AFCF|nr:hypothetical protein [Neglectibacter sp. M00184]